MELFLPVLVLFVAVLVWERMVLSGRLNEKTIVRAIEKANLPGRHRVYSNLLVPRQGKATSTSEVDVLLLHESGLYVIESKDYKGWIFGSADQQKWTVSYKGGAKNQFFNPLLQNRSHVNALSAYLGVVPGRFSSYVVFSNRAELKKIPESAVGQRVMTVGYLRKMLLEDAVDSFAPLSPEEYARIEQALDKLAEGSTKEAQKQHVDQVKQVQAGNVCPYCGSALVERRRKSDGGKFIGCSAFPKCRYTRNSW
ncbi:MAG: NERD domain-containing protein [Coriobacteriia bacterium]|nr:NERD domain-containing protein [Coriobacteriia bacterium]